MIFTLDYGQLANNILQYGHVFAWAKENGQRCIGLRFASKYPTGFKICHDPLHYKIVYLLVKTLVRLKLIPQISYTEGSINANKAEKDARMKKAILSFVQGWNIRNYGLFLKYKSDIVSLFTFDKDIQESVNQKFHQIEHGEPTIRIGVHIRRGDYKWLCPNYYYEAEEYLQTLKETLKLFGEQKIQVFICSNDPRISETDFATITSEKVSVQFPHGNAYQDLYLLSQCDYIIGAPSTYSLVATMYGKAKIKWLLNPTEGISLLDFHTFEETFTEYDSLFADIEKSRHEITIIVNENFRNFMSINQKLNEILKSDSTLSHSIKIINAPTRESGLLKARGMFVWYIDENTAITAQTLSSMVATVKNNLLVDVIDFSQKKDTTDIDRLSHFVFNQYYLHVNKISEQIDTIHKQSNEQSCIFSSCNIVRGPEIL